MTLKIARVPMNAVLGLSVRCDGDLQLVRPGPRQIEWRNAPPRASPIGSNPFFCAVQLPSEYGSTALLRSADGTSVPLFSWTSTMLSGPPPPVGCAGQPTPANVFGLSAVSPSSVLMKNERVPEPTCGRYR